MSMEKVVVSENRCKACGYCIDYCPKEVLSLTDKLNVLGYRYVEVTDEEMCTACGICAMVCPDIVFEIYR